MRGHVIYYLRDTGFGVEFSSLSGEETAPLRRLMQHYREHPPDADAGRV